MMYPSVPIRPFSVGALPAPTGAEAAAFDRHAIEGRGVPEAALMESAGRAAAELLQKQHPEGLVVALVGGGNNGGDALVALRTLCAWDRPVRAIIAGERARPDPLLRDWPVRVESEHDLDDRELESLLSKAAVLVDGLLGTGLRGPPRARTARLIDAANASATPVLALDVPSGIDADDGTVPGPAVQARTTLAFGWPKLGTLLFPARACAGRLLVAEVGFPPADGAGWGARLLTPAWASLHLPRREPDAHKNAVGSVLVVGGRSGMAGAVVLAVRAALRAGAGFVRVASEAANREILQEAVPDAPFVDLADPVALDAALAASDALAVGPGLGTDAEAEAALGRVLDGPVRPAVMDADALNLLAQGRPVDLATAGARGPLVITPHPGEMSRLTGHPTREVQADRLGAARRLARVAGCVVLLKGAPSLIAEPSGSVSVSGVGGSDLAVAGMGDVLTGTLGAFLGQVSEPAEASGLALIVTARAAARTGLGPGLAASDVTEAVAGALTERGRGDTTLDFGWLTLDLDPPA